MLTTTTPERQSNDFFSLPVSSGVACLSLNVGSTADFLPSSTRIENDQENLPIENDRHDDQTKMSTSVERESLSETNHPVGKEKLGHRRVDESGTITYKRVMVDDLIKCLQIGFQHVIGQIHQPQRPVLIQDFQETDYQDFPPQGSSTTPTHPYAQFRLKTYAPVAFRFFRNAFGVDTSTFMSSMCDKDLKELSNPGASGSIFYITADDTYIIKTVSKKEARFLLSLLPGYYLNLTQNPSTLLPKFFGLFCYQNVNKNIRFVIMNNLIPTNVRLHEKYDLKGSIYKRKASEEEHKRDLPTLKDNDFKVFHPSGLILEPFVYDQLVQTIQDDVQVLRSFGIMDYSFLLGVHNITKEMKSTLTLPSLPVLPADDLQDSVAPQTPIATYSQYLRVIEFIKEQQDSPVLDAEQIQVELNSDTASIQTVRAEASPVINRRNVLEEKTNDGIFNGTIWCNRKNLSRLTVSGIPAMNKDGDLLLLYVGIIDILQNYRLRKKLEHAIKSTLVTREEVSVCNPIHYGDRFVRFLSRRVFRKSGSEIHTILSDSQSNTDRMTLHSSKFLPSSYRSHLSDDGSASSITNNNESNRNSTQ